MKKILVTLLCTFILLTLSPLPLRASEPSKAYEEPSEPAIAELWDYLEAARFGEEAALPSAAPEFNFDLSSALLCEAETGTVLFELNADQRHSPASVTKVMTLLLIMEALDGGVMTETDTVTASEHAVSMGGTQIYLEVGEQMTVKELILAVSVPSANDAAVALAEHIAGSEEEFVRRMNERAKELGMTETAFTNATGLFDDELHYTSARDIALMTAELLKHEKILEYTTVWTDSLRNGQFGLANTNKMLRTYNGMNGMKTGYTQKSRYCFSGTAKRDGMTLIVTIMGAVSSEERFKASATLLNYGFASFALAKNSDEVLPLVNVKKGKLFTAEAELSGGFCLVVPKGTEKKISLSIEMEQEIEAPAEKGRQVGTAVWSIDGRSLKSCPIVLKYSLERAGMGDYLARLAEKLL